MKHQLFEERRKYAKQCFSLSYAPQHHVTWVDRRYGTTSQEYVGPDRRTSKASKTLKEDRRKN